jgi:hypothetical protein
MLHLSPTAAALLLLAPGAAPAADPAPDAPEHLLPASTQVYVRWDGLAAHRTAYNKTAVGKMMRGDTGVFVTGLADQLQEGFGTLLTVEQLLGGVPPDKLQKLQADATEAAKLFAVLGDSGFVFAAEVRSVEPPQGQVTLIIPGGAAKSGPLFGALRLAVGLAKGEVNARKVEGRAVEVVEAGPVHIAWWVEGKHALVTVGTDTPEAVVKGFDDAKRARLTANPLFKRVHGFDKFETGARAFVDAAALVQLGRTRGKEVSQLLDDLGLGGMRGLVAYSGFDGEAERGLVEVDLQGPRKGLLTLLKGKPFRLADVPPLPPDVVSWSMTNFDSLAFYDAALVAAERIAAIVSPDDVPKVKGFPVVANTVLGVDLRDELLASLGDQVVFYNAPSEGPLTLGQTVLVKVKDARKLQDAVEQLIKAVAKLTNAEVSIRKRTYQGVETREVHVRQQGFFFVPTYAVHKDWLVVAAYPQPVMGYLQRAAGGLPAWKASPRVEESFAQLPREFISVSYADPRPSLRQLLSLAPLIGGAVHSFNPDLKFEVGSIPNAQEATEPLFPNVSVTTDDGKALRLETRASLQLPFDVTGIDTYALGFAFLGAFRVAF